MEDASIVIGLFRVLKEVLARLWHVLGKETQMNVSTGRVNDR